MKTLFSNLNLNLKKHWLTYHLHQASKKGDATKIMKYLGLGADVNSTGFDTKGTPFNWPNKHTSLHNAFERLHFDAVKILLVRGANPNCENWVGMTPLDLLWKKLGKKIEKSSEEKAQKLWIEGCRISRLIKDAGGCHSTQSWLKDFSYNVSEFESWRQITIAEEEKEILEQSLFESAPLKPSKPKNRL